MGSYSAISPSTSLSLSSIPIKIFTNTHSLFHIESYQVLLRDHATSFRLQRKWWDAHSCQVMKIMFPAAFFYQRWHFFIECEWVTKKLTKCWMGEEGDRWNRGLINKFAMFTFGDFSACLISFLRLTSKRIKYSVTEMSVDSPTATPYRECTGLIMNIHNILLKCNVSELATRVLWTRLLKPCAHVRHSRNLSHGPFRLRENRRRHSQGMNDLRMRRMKDRGN